MKICLEVQGHDDDDDDVQYDGPKTKIKIYIYFLWYSKANVQLKRFGIRHWSENGYALILCLKVFNLDMCMEILCLSHHLCEASGWRREIDETSCGFIVRTTFKL